MKKFLFVFMVALSVMVAGGCKKKDKCKDTVCLNGGICIDGTCSCPTGYTGSDCGEQVLPSKITLDSVRVTKFPTNNNGSDWDNNLTDNPKPDLYVKLKIAGGAELFHNKTDRVNNADAKPYILPIIPYDFTNLTQLYNIELLDYDNLSSDDSMGNFDFNIYSNTNKFPKKMKISNTAGTIEFELTLTYTY